MRGRQTPKNSAGPLSPEVIRARLVERLARRESTQTEARRYLKRCFPGPEAGVMIEEQLRAAVERGWIEDLRAGRIWAREWFERGHGPRAIQAKLLALKGVRTTEEVIRGWVEEGRTEDSLVEKARTWAKRRYPGAFESTERRPGDRRRAYAALIRRGFDPEIVREVLLPQDRDSG